MENENLFKELRLKAGLSQSKAAQHLGKSVKTIQRWEASTAPLIAIRAIEYQAGHALGWEGFYFGPGVVGTPTRRTISSHQVDQLVWLANLYRSIIETQTRSVGVERREPANSQEIDIPHVSTTREISQVN